ncbi:helix-turn-helix domain-containing protein [Pedobacter sp. L105]
MNVNIVAAKVGYESPSTFSNVFMSFTGIRPTEYVKIS